MPKKLIKGNEAVGKAAIMADCKFFFGYPITPQNEIPEYMSKYLPEVGGTYVQAESEVGAINMVYGAAGAGARVMTSSSGPGISLKMEGISYIAGAELPCVIVNIVRGGPGLGGIQPAQSDYFQVTKGGGHGDYRMIVFAPASVQELFDLTMEAFEVADKYRNPVMVYADGVLGQMMEPIQYEEKQVENSAVKDWATTGIDNRKDSSPNIINSLFLDPEKLEEHNFKLKEKYNEVEKKEVKYEILHEDADYYVVAYGTSARVAKNAIKQAREKGINVGLIRPITIWPFPYKVINQLVNQGAKGFLTVEMSTGQLIEDVRLGVGNEIPVKLYARVGGMLPSPDEILREIEKLHEEVTG